VGSTVREQVLKAIERHCPPGTLGGVSGADLAEALPKVRRSTLFAQLSHLSRQRVIEADLFKQPQGADGRPVTVYRLPALKPSPSQEIESIARDLLRQAKRLEELAKIAGVQGPGNP
jgi:hypothetical protein